MLTDDDVTVVKMLRRAFYEDAEIAETMKLPFADVRAVGRPDPDRQLRPEEFAPTLRDALGEADPRSRRFAPPTVKMQGSVAVIDAGHWKVAASPRELRGDLARSIAERIAAPRLTGDFATARAKELTAAFDHATAF